MNAAVRKAVLFLGLVVWLGGCGTQQLTQGEPNFNTAILLPGYQVPDATHPSIGARNEVTLGLQPTKLPDVCGPATQSAITQCVYAVKALIDDQYREYRITLHHFADQGNAAADIAVLGLTTAATGPVSLIAKTVLSGFSTVIGGAKSILNQDLLYKQTIEIVINQMEADRDQQFTIMISEMNGGNYTLEQAKDDLLAYFAAGTWDHAVASLQSTVAANQANCKAQTNSAKVSASKGSPSSTPAASTSSTACPSVAEGNAPTLSPTTAVTGAKFAATSGPGIYLVKLAAASATDNITVDYAADGKTFVSLAPMPFAQFAKLVQPTPISSS